MSSARVRCRPVDKIYHYSFPALSKRFVCAGVSFAKIHASFSVNYTLPGFFSVRLVGLFRLFLRYPADQASARPAAVLRCGSPSVRRFAATLTRRRRRRRMRRDGRPTAVPRDAKPPPPIWREFGGALGGCCCGGDKLLVSGAHGVAAMTTSGHSLRRTRQVRLGGVLSKSNKR